MKPIITITVILIATGFYSCKKSDVKLTALTSVNFTNAVVGGPTLYLNAVTDSVPNNGFGEFTLYSGQTQYKVFASNQAQPLYNQTASSTDGSYYSLFISGLSGSAADAVFIKESYKNYTDSLCGVRFINLSPDSQPISVDIAGDANGSEVSSLAYKAYTAFKQHPATQAITSYNFEVRDAATGNLLTTYTLNTPYFHNVTLAVTGSENGGSIGVLQDNDY